MTYFLAVDLINYLIINRFFSGVLWMTRKRLEPEPRIPKKKENLSGSLRQAFELSM
jgi:hypothetical protein